MDKLQTNALFLSGELKAYSEGNISPDRLQVLKLELAEMLADLNEAADTLPDSPSIPKSDL